MSPVEYPLAATSAAARDPIDIPAVFEAHIQLIRSLEVLLPAIRDVAARCVTAVQNGGKIVWMGNGGSAADSQHMAAELVSRFRRERRALPSIALTTDTSILTAIANDYSFDRVFARQVEGLCGPRDILIGLSTSGNSVNVVKAFEAGREIGAFTVALTGSAECKLAKVADIALQVDSTETARIQEAHTLIGHIVCDWIESEASMPV